jgi:hypothetical protein
MNQNRIPFYGIVTRVMFLLTIGFAGQQFIPKEPLSSDIIFQELSNTPHIFHLSSNYETNIRRINAAFNTSGDYVVMLIGSKVGIEIGTYITPTDSDERHYYGEETYEILQDKKQTTNKKLLIYVLPESYINYGIQYLMAAGDYIAVDRVVKMSKFQVTERSIKKERFIEGRIMMLNLYEDELHEVYTNRSKLFVSEKMNSMNTLYFTPKEWLDIHTSPSGLFDEIQNLDQFCQYAKSLGVLGFTGELNKDSMIFINFGALRRNRGWSRSWSWRSNDRSWVYKYNQGNILS